VSEVVRIILLWVLLIFAISLAVGLAVSHALHWLALHYVPRAECPVARIAGHLRCADCGGALLRGELPATPSEGAES
jgi:hypothetical protein